MMIRSARLQSVVDAVQPFWQWWRGELARSVPPALARHFKAGGAKLLVSVEDGTARLDYIGNGESRLLAATNLDTDSDGELVALGQQLLEELAPETAVHVILPAHQVLRRKVVMPLAVAANLGNVLGFELDRLTPFRPDQAGYGYRLLERYPARDKLLVELVVARQDYLRHLLSRLELLGLNPVAVYPPLDGEPVATLNLLSDRQRPSPEPLLGRKARQLAAIAAVLLLLALFYPAWQLGQTYQALGTEVEDIRREASAIADIQSRLAGRLAAHDALVDLRNERPGKLVILQTITRLLPDHTWVSRLNMDSRGITLQGESRTASDLIALLEDSPLFANVAFSSPITRNPVTDRERFEIQMELAPP